MAYEIAKRYAGGVIIAIPVNKLSDRSPHSDEVNEGHGEGGGLNANYRTADALCMLSNALGHAGIRYHEHFYFKTGGGNSMQVEFRDETVARSAQSVLDRIMYRAAA